MERRQTAERRQVHLFVAEDRRRGPHDRRKANLRLVDLEKERAKIERIRALKEKDKTKHESTNRPLFPTNRLIYLGLVLVIVLAVLFLII
jgi:hypothetical protein